MVGVLILVHHYVPKLVLIEAEHIGVLFKKPDGVTNYVVKIHGVGLFELLLIELVGLGDV